MTEPEPPSAPEPGAAAEPPGTETPGPENSEATPVDSENGAAENPGGETAAENPDGAAAAQDFEGPRRRARRERAERRAAEERARALEEARLQAKRRARGIVTEDGAAARRRGVRGLKLMLISVLLTVLAVGVGLILYFTPVMSARDIVVVGTGAVTAEEVLAAAAVPPGTPLLQINTTAVADRVAAIRPLASARVQREYPSTLRITIAERIPVAVKDFPEGPRLYDRDGVDFVIPAPPPNLPYLDVENPGPADPPTQAALAVLTSLRPEVAGQVGRVAAPSVSSITLILTDGREVVWGTDDRTDEKAEKLAALLTQPGRVFDVSSPDLPTVK